MNKVAVPFANRHLQSRRMWSFAPFAAHRITAAVTVKRDIAIMKALMEQTSSGPQRLIAAMWMPVSVKIVAQPMYPMPGSAASAGAHWMRKRKAYPLPPHRIPTTKIKSD